MRPLPRLIAVTTDAIVTADDYPVRAAAIAASGPGVAILVRAPGLSSARRLAALERARALTVPPEAALLAHADPALGRIGRAHGVQLRAGDLGCADARAVFGPGWIGVSVHDAAQACAARDEGADYLVAGPVFATATHPGRDGRGAAWLGGIVAAGLPVFAIGGMDPGRVADVRNAGAWGVAAISALWHAADSARATESMLLAWETT
jgi:thiamine-phosphate diphosphorylase